MGHCILNWKPIRTTVKAGNDVQIWTASVPGVTICGKYEGGHTTSRVDYFLTLQNKRTQWISVTGKNVCWFYLKGESVVLGQQL